MCYCTWQRRCPPGLILNVTLCLPVFFSELRSNTFLTKWAGIKFATATHYKHYSRAFSSDEESRTWITYHKYSDIRLAFIIDSSRITKIVECFFFLQVKIRENSDIEKSVSSLDGELIIITTKTVTIILDRNCWVILGTNILAMGLGLSCLKPSLRMWEQLCRTSKLSTQLVF